MYNDSRIYISHNNGDLEVQLLWSSGINIGKIKPSCEGYITFSNMRSKEFEFNEKTKEIVWTGHGAGYKWIGGYFC